MIVFRGYRIDPDAGVVFGRYGRPIKKRDSKGYIRVKNKLHSEPAHRLIWESMNGPITVGMQINHINDIKFGRTWRHI